MRSISNDKWGLHNSSLQLVMAEMQVTQRQPHAALDLESRRRKGIKIERLLALPDSSSVIRLLEVGTGSGGIAHYFASHTRLDCDVDAVDVKDSRLVREGFRFQLVEGPLLPFADAAFDVVVSNHVIEHVGDAANQREHLSELRRVLCEGGVGYLAVPNRWMVVEPHYRLAFLSWLPRAWRTPYLKWMRKGTYYDCEPLQVGSLESMLDSVGLNFKSLYPEAMHAVLEIERPHWIGTRILSRLPKWSLWPLRWIIPTLIYRIWR